MYGKGAYGSPVESFPTPGNWPPASSSSETGGYVPPKGYPGQEGQHQQYQQPSYYAPAPPPNSGPYPPAGSYPAQSPPPNPGSYPPPTGSYPPGPGSYPPKSNQVSYPPQDSYSASYPPLSTPYPPTAPYPPPSTTYPPASAPYPQHSAPDPYRQGPYPSYPPRTDPPLPIFPPNHPGLSSKPDKPCFSQKEDALDPYLNNEIHQVANLFYKDLSAETKKTVSAFFKNMDKDGDGLVTLPELQQALPGRKVEKLFRFLDRNNSGDLNFWEMVTFYYIFHYKPTCDHCGEAILGTYYSCAECWLAGAGEDVGESFDLCISCYSKKEYFHPHDDLLDHNMLLAALRRIITVSDADAKKKVKGENSLLEELILQMAALSALEAGKTYI